VSLYFYLKLTFFAEPRTGDICADAASVDPVIRARGRNLDRRLNNETVFMNRKKLKCDIKGCRFYTFDPLKLEVHIKKKHHEDPEPYSCNCCEMKFSKLTLLRRHNQRCPVPVKKIVKKRVWKKRKRKSVGLADSLPNQCKICSKRFGTEEELKIHLELHRERQATSVDLTFSCVMPTCDKWFVCSTELRAHVLQDHEDTRYKCTVCDLVSYLNCTLLIIIHAEFFSLDN